LAAIGDEIAHHALPPHSGREGERHATTLRHPHTHTFDERLNAEKARVLWALQKTNPGRHRELLERRIQQIEIALDFNNWVSSVGEPPGRRARP
jgi:hypothetical protein